MANHFKKHLTFLAKKSAKLVINREDDTYYICDGFTMLKMPDLYYEVYARPVSSAFIPLENGQSAIKQPGDIMPKLSAPTYCTSKIFNSHDAKLSAAITDLMCLSDGKKVIRFVGISGDKVAMYNNSYIDAALEYADFDKFHATADRFPVLKWENPDIRLGCLVMPVNNPRALEHLATIGSAADK